MEYFNKIRVVLAIGTSLAGCATGGGQINSNSGIDYRHPLFHESNRFFRLEEKTTFRGVLNKGEGHVPHTHGRTCVSSFSHPLLNRCENFKTAAITPTEIFQAPPGSDPVDLRLQLASRARGMLRKPASLHSGGRFSADCSGFVLSVLAKQGVDTRALMSRSSGVGGVAGIFLAARDRGMVHHRKVPAIGDLVFFSNTYDRNGDGKANDPLTHIGIVERVDADGTVSFIHHVKRGVLRYKLNRFRPAERRDKKTQKVLNHYLRLGPRTSRSVKRLTGELFQAFATVIR